MEGARHKYIYIQIFIVAFPKTRSKERKLKVKAKPVDETTLCNLNKDISFVSSGTWNYLKISKVSPERWPVLSAHFALMK